MWTPGYHCRTDKFIDTNTKLSEIEGDITTKEAQVAFAKFCCANPHWAAKILMGIDLYPIQDVMIRAMMQKDFFLGVCGRGFGKSTIAGVFLPLYAIFNPGVKIGITSQTFRQSRNIFEKIEEAIASPKGKFLKQCLNGPPKHNNDAWSMKFGTSEIVALPLGCVTGNTLIRTSNGLKRISALEPEMHTYEYGVTYKPWKRGLCWANIDEQVDTLDGVSRCTNVLYKREEECLELVLRGGFGLQGSKKHKVLVYSKDGEHLWKELSRITLKDYVAIDVRERFSKQPEFNLTSEIGYKYGCQQVFSKATDERILNCSENFGRGFFAGIFESAGEYSSNGYGNKPCISVAMKSEDIAKDVQIACLSYGFVIKRMKNKLFITKFKLRSFLEKFPTVKKNLKSILPDIPTPSYGAISSSEAEKYDKGFMFCKIISKKKLGKVPVYDLRVPAYNNYISNGFVSHNSGDKIRGYRFNLLVIDELLLLSEKVINEVLMPFMAIQANPRERQKIRDEETAMINAGVMTEDERTVFSSNKLIGLTSASYQFEYLYKMFQDYKDQICDKEAKNVSHAVMQLSCEIAPIGLYDEKNIEMAKKTFSQSQYDREYMAHFTGDSSGFFSAKSLHAVSLEKGEFPTVLVKGDRVKDYILAIDPNYDSSETSDDFAMCLVELDHDARTAVMVHGYALASCTLQERMGYVKYLFDNFNIIYMIVDRAAGAKFIKDINDLEVLDFKLGIFEADFDTFSEEELFEARKSYSNDTKVKNIVHAQNFSAQWIRYANETLQGAIENRTIMFGSPVDAEEISVDSLAPIIKELKFDDTEYKNDRDSLKMKLGDFVDRQAIIIGKTKRQCALIEASSGGGAMKFDLPQSLKKQTGPDKARKDSYSALLLANWGKECYFNMMSAPVKKKNRILPRFLV